MTYPEHRHRWAPGPEDPDSTALVMGCQDCGIRKPVRPKVVGGRLICLDCKRPLIGWRTDFAGHWSGPHFCQ